MKKYEIYESEINEKMLKKIFDKFFPDIFTMLPNWEEQFENLDYSQPKTFMREIEKDIESRIKPPININLNFLLWLIRRFLLKSSFFKNEFVQIPNKMAKLVKNLAKEDSRYSLLLELISEVDIKYPFSPLLITFRHGDIRKTFPVTCSPMPYLVEAEKTEGEKRAFYVCDAMRNICEHIYQPYIKTLWILSYLRNGNLPPTNEPSYGNMLDVCFKNLPKKYHNLIESNAVIMRNSPSHNILNWNDETDSIILKDKEKRIEISVDELLEKLRSMQQISSFTISRVGQLYMFRICGRDGIMEKIYDSLPAFFSNDKMRIQLAKTELYNFVVNILKIRGVLVDESKALSN